MTRLLAIGAGLLALGGAASAGTVADQEGSWPDTLHGWARWSGGLGCTPRADLCATDDGGATWRGIFKGAIDQFVRTSVRAGVVSLDDGSVFWTRDGARHWYRTTRIFGRFTGAGKYLFATSGADLYRVTPWPPRGRARCRTWRVVAGDARTSSTVCAAGVANAAMQDRLLATVHGTTIGAVTPVPGGVFGVADFEPDFSRLNAFVWRNGRLTQTALPFPEPAWWCCANVDAAWPSLYVSASLYAPPGSAGTPIPVLWSSRDGGASWSVYSGG